MNFNDDVDYSGSANRGMQEEDLAGAINSLQQLRGRLGMVKGGAGAQRHFAPVDSSQVGVNIFQSILTPAVTAATWPDYPFQGQTTTYKTFKPNRITVSEMLVYTFRTSALGDAQMAVSVPDASDLIMVAANCGADNAFPYQPTKATGLDCSSIQAVSIGSGISWPLIKEAIPVVVGFLLLATALYRATPPAGYTIANLIQLDVVIKTSFFGPKKR